ncbi:hypothetical protein [Mumia sp. Pv 4-285]|uniref:hypothetical protein n=1 Tax=Mumia qirimensis TaxID=3234852 RepID=UPI00351D6CFC
MSQTFHQPPGPSAPPAGPLDVRVLRHPTESSRFALALVATATGTALVLVVVLGALSIAEQAAYVVGLVALLVVFWITLQIWRVRLLADAIRVDEATLPDLDRIVQDVRGRLGFDRRVDIFVVDKIGRVVRGETRTTMTTTYFGVRVVLVEAGLVGDLRNLEDRQRCTFLMATIIGALKARHSQWSAVLEVLHSLKLTVLVAPLVTPWLRATVYTGDRLAYACTGDLDVSLKAAYQSLVGSSVASDLHATGLVGQAISVRRNPILRLAQLLRSAPHVPNRYLELLGFAEAYQVGAYAQFRHGLAAHTSDLDQVVARHSRRRDHVGLVPVAFTLSAGLVVAGLVGAVALADTLDEGTTPQAVPTTPPVTTLPPTTPTFTPADALLAYVPATLQAGCSGTDPADYAVSAVASFQCTSGEEPVLTYVGFSSTEELHEEFQSYGTGSYDNDCGNGIDGSVPWTGTDGLEQGLLMCVSTEDGANVVWTDDDDGVLGFASASTMAPSDLVTWWDDVVRP